MKRNFLHGFIGFLAIGIFALALGGCPMGDDGNNNDGSDGPIDAGTINQNALRGAGKLNGLFGSPVHVASVGTPVPSGSAHMVETEVDFTGGRLQITNDENGDIFESPVPYSLEGSDMVKFSVYAADNTPRKYTLYYTFDASGRLILLNLADILNQIFTAANYAMAFPVGENFRFISYEVVNTQADSSGSTGDIPATVLEFQAENKVMAEGNPQPLEINVQPPNATVHYSSSDPSIASVDERTGIVTPIREGEVIITARSGNITRTIPVAILPNHAGFEVTDPENEVDLITSPDSSNSANNLDKYKTEPSQKLAYRFRNPSDGQITSHTMGGIDVLGKGGNSWMITTYRQGGWFYDLNGEQGKMTDGVQVDTANRVKLTIKPYLVYENNIPYLLLVHFLKNEGSSMVTGQKFGAAADVMIHRNDQAPLKQTDYGALMTDSTTLDSQNLALKLMCKSGIGVTPSDTLWLGTYASNSEGTDYRFHVYDDGINSSYQDIVDGNYVGSKDSAIAFSWQDITLTPGETKTYKVRFTLAEVTIEGSSPLTGTVSISGTAKVGETLTALTSSLGGSGTISYQWIRGSTNVGTNSSSYSPVTADVGSAIKVQVSRAGYSGSVTSGATAVVQAAGGGGSSGGGGASSLAMVSVAGGSFQMGIIGHQNDAQPVHTVTVSTFSMGKYEVTQKEWIAVMGSLPSSIEKKGDNLPVQYVSWYDAVEFCNKLSQKEGLTPAYSGSGTSTAINLNANGYRLPTEAEWEYAAKGGPNKDTYTYSGSNTAGSVAWYGDYDSGVHPVGTKTANSLGIYDLSGNVREWCGDWYGYYSEESQTNPTGPVPVTVSEYNGRVWRGGYFGDGDLDYLGTTWRRGDSPLEYSRYLGFRVVRR